MKKKIARQGDMLFFKVNSLNVMNRRKTNKLVVGLGEVTGHSHDIFPVAGGTVTAVSETENLEVSENDLAMMDKLFFEVAGKGAVVVHEEHDTIHLEEGTYLRMNQVELNPFTNELQKVKD